MEYSQAAVHGNHLPDELKERINQTSLAINGCVELFDAQVLVDQLNGEVADDGLVGVYARIESRFFIRTRHTLNKKQGRFDLSTTDEPSGDSVTNGLFVGFEQYRYEDQTILMYKLQVPLDPTTMSFDVVCAPVGESTMFVYDAVGSEAAHATSEELMYKHLELLASIKEPIFSAYLKDFVGLIESTDRVDAAFFSELGVYAAYMLARAELRNDTVKTKAIVSVIDLLVDHAEEYYVEAHDFTPEEVAVIKGVVRVTGVELVQDYDFNGASMRLALRNGFQPAFVVEDLEGRTRRLPLQYLEDFATAYIYAEDSSCSASVKRFKETVYIPRLIV